MKYKKLLATGAFFGAVVFSLVATDAKADLVTVACDQNLPGQLTGLASSADSSGWLPFVVNQMTPGTCTEDTLDEKDVKAFIEANTGCQANLTCAAHIGNIVCTGKNEYGMPSKLVWRFHLLGEVLAAFEGESLRETAKKTCEHLKLTAHTVMF